MSKKYEYIESSDYSGFALIEVIDIAGLVKFTEVNSIKFVFRKGAKDKESAPDEFFVTSGTVAYKIKAVGFIWLEDFNEAVQKGFPDSEGFYLAKKGGYTTYQEYIQTKDLGIDKKELFEKAKETGFVQYFNSFVVALQEMNIIFKWLINAAGSKQKMRQFMKKGKNLSDIGFAIVDINKWELFIIKAEP